MTAFGVLLEFSLKMESNWWSVPATESCPPLSRSSIANLANVLALRHTAEWHSQQISPVKWAPRQLGGNALTRRVHTPEADYHLAGEGAVRQL